MCITVKVRPSHTGRTNAGVSTLSGFGTVAPSIQRNQETCSSNRWAMDRHSSARSPPERVRYAWARLVCHPGSRSRATLYFGPVPELLDQSGFVHPVIIWELALPARERYAGYWLFLGRRNHTGPSRYLQKARFGSAYGAGLASFPLGLTPVALQAPKVAWAGVGFPCSPLPVRASEPGPLPLAAWKQVKPKESWRTR